MKYPKVSKTERAVRLVLFVIFALVVWWIYFENVSKSM